MKARSDAERFARYQAVVDALLAKESFRKSDIYPSFKPEEKIFIGRIIHELLQDGCLGQNGAKSKPFYSWTENKKNFNPGRWIDQRVFTPTVKRSLPQTVRGNAFFDWGRHNSKHLNSSRSFKPTGESVPMGYHHNPLSFWRRLMALKKWLRL